MAADLNRAVLILLDHLEQSQDVIRALKALLIQKSVFTKTEMDAAIEAGSCVRKAAQAGKLNETESLDPDEDLLARLRAFEGPAQ